jgi:hypothetical protein
MEFAAPRLFSLLKVEVEGTPAYKAGTMLTQDLETLI